MLQKWDKGEAEPAVRPRGEQNVGEQDSRRAAAAAADKDSLASKADGGARSTPDTDPTPNQELRRRLYELLSTDVPPRPGCLGTWRVTRRSNAI